MKQNSKTTDPLCSVCDVRHISAGLGCPHADCPHKSDAQTTVVDAPLYIEFRGQKYVRLDHAVKKLNASAEDAIEAAAALIESYPRIRTTIAELAAGDIRSLKTEIGRTLECMDV